MSSNLSVDWESFQAAAEEANQLNKTVVLEALSRAGITHVCVTFDGEGDQGQIEKVLASTGTETREFPAVMLAVQIAQFGKAELTAREMSLQDAIEQLCYGYLNERHAGWEIDDGSLGEFTFDVAARTITLDFSGRVFAYEHSTGTF